MLKNNNTPGTLHNQPTVQEDRTNATHLDTSQGRRSKVPRPISRQAGSGDGKLPRQVLAFLSLSRPINVFVCKTRWPGYIDYQVLNTSCDSYVFSITTMLSRKQKTRTDHDKVSHDAARERMFYHRLKGRTPGTCTLSNSIQNKNKSKTVANGKRRTNDTNIYRDNI